MEFGSRGSVSRTSKFRDKSRGGSGGTSAGRQMRLPPGRVKEERGLGGFSWARKPGRPSRIPTNLSAPRAAAATHRRGRGFGCSQVPAAEERIHLLGEHVGGLFGEAERDGLVQQFLQGTDAQVGEHARFTVGHDAEGLSVLEGFCQELHGAVVKCEQLAIEGRVHAGCVREQDLGRRPFGQAGTEDGADVGANLVSDRTRRVVGDDPLNRRGDLGGEAIDQLRKHGAFVVEVEIKRAACDARLGDDVVDRCLVVAAAGKHVASRVEDLAPPFGLLRLGAALAGRHGDFGYRVSGIRYRVSGIGYQVSGIGYTPSRSLRRTVSERDACDLVRTDLDLRGRRTRRREAPSVTEGIARHSNQRDSSTLHSLASKTDADLVRSNASAACQWTPKSRSVPLSSALQRNVTRSFERFLRERARKSLTESSSNRFEISTSSRPRVTKGRSGRAAVVGLPSASKAQRRPETSALDEQPRFFSSAGMIVSAIGTRSPLDGACPPPKDKSSTDDKIAPPAISQSRPMRSITLFIATPAGTGAGSRRASWSRTSTRSARRTRARPIRAPRTKSRASCVFRAPRSQRAA